MELDEAKELTAKELTAMLETCRRALPGVEGRHDALADAVRDTCRAIEARLVELGVGPDRGLARRH